MSFRILFVDGESPAASEASQSRRFYRPGRCRFCRRFDASKPPVASTEAAANTSASSTRRNSRQSMRCRSSVSLLLPKIEACRECKPKQRGVEP